MISGHVIVFNRGGFRLVIVLVKGMDANRPRGQAGDTGWQGLVRAMGRYIQTRAEYAGAERRVAS